MRNSRFLIAASVIVAAVVLASSCEKDFLWGGKGRPGRSNSVGMKINGASSSSLFETKAGGSVKPANVFSSDDGGFTIEEYVRDIEYTSGAPVTKGTEIITDNLHTACGSFTVDAWAMLSENFPVPDGDKVATQYFKKDYKYSGSVWGWDGEEPTWVTSTPITMWSYAPESVFGTTPPAVDQTTNKEFEKITFSHTVKKSLEAQEDIIVAYNKETRDFNLEPGYDDRYYYEFHANADDADVFDASKGNPANGKVNIHFYHALAAVKFELNSTIAGSNIDVHSITLCVTDNTTAKNIILDGGIATSGYCEATGSVDTVSNVPTPKINFVWKADSLKNRKPLHYEFDSSHSVAGGYTETGNGILFMIPQTLPTGMKIIVEFSKNGSTNYNTKVLNLPAVTWAAGKYYTYRLKIGELHVPGENFTELVDVDIVGLKNSGDNIQPSSALSIKGVTKMGLVINSWSLGSKAGQTVYLNAIIDGDSQVEYKTVDKVTSPDESNTDFNFNFAPVSESAVPGTNNKIYTFGTDNAEETYHKYYSFSPPTGSGKSAMGTPNIGPFYYVFNTTGASTFKIIFTPAAGDNSGGFFADVRCLIVIEIASDPNLPGNFNTIDWDNI